MKKLSKNIWVSALSMLLISGTAFAQTPAKTDPVPPKLEKLEEISASEAALSVGKPEPRNKVTEKRNNAGKVTEVQVKSGKSNYTLKADPEVGNTPKGTASTNRAPQWTVMEFGGKKESKEAPEPLPVLPPAPKKAAPASAASANK